MTDAPKTYEDMARECAAKLIKAVRISPGVYYHDLPAQSTVSALILSTIRNAVERERERCAKVADPDGELVSECMRLHCSPSYTAGMIRQRIRNPTD